MVQQRMETAPWRRPRTVGLLAGLVLCLLPAWNPLPSLRWQPPGPLERAGRGLRRATILPTVPAVAAQPDPEGRAESDLAWPCPYETARNVGALHPGHESGFEEGTPEVPQRRGATPGRAPESSGCTGGSTPCPFAGLPWAPGSSCQHSGDRSAVWLLDGCLDARGRWIRSDSCLAESLFSCRTQAGASSTGAASWSCPSPGWSCWSCATCTTCRDPSRLWRRSPGRVVPTSTQDAGLHGTLAGLSVLWSGGRSVYGGYAGRSISTVTRQQFPEEQTCFDLAESPCQPLSWCNRTCGSHGDYTTWCCTWSFRPPTCSYGHRTRRGLDETPSKACPGALWWPSHAKVEHIRSIDPSKRPVPAVVSDDDELGHPPPEPGGDSLEHQDATGDAV